MTEWGLRVDLAEDGSSALASLRDHNYDAILVDIRMAPMSGIELYRRIKEIGQASKVVLITEEVLRPEASASLSDAAPQWLRSQSI